MVDHEIEFGGLLHRQILGLGALQDPIDVARRLPVKFGNVLAVADQGAGPGMIAVETDRGKPVLSSRLGNLRPLSGKERIGGDDDSTGILLGRFGKGGRDRLPRGGIHRYGFDAQRRCVRLHMFEHCGIGRIARVQQHGDT
jgi:hypothetical protein